MDEYPTWVGFVFVFNLVVGTGSLLLPKAFSETGWLLSSVLIVFLAFTSYLTVTFVVEAMSNSNAILKWRRMKFAKRENSSNQRPHSHHIVVEGSEDGDSQNSGDSTEDDEHRSLMDQIDPPNPQIPDNALAVSDHFYTLNEKVELGEMSTIFFPQWGAIMFYVCIAIYLYGDLSIYNAAVSTTLRDVICDRNITNSSVVMNETTLLNQPCWEGKFATRFDIYRICLIFFSLLMSPWVFFNVSKTKYLQFMTMTFRWVAFAIMISIAVYRIILPPDGEIVPNPPKANINAIPFLIGSSIYSFMSQHSIPSLLVPIKDKNQIAKIVSLDYFLIAILYLILALTGIFAFANLEDLYTLNFIPSKSQESIMFEGIEYFLTLFPVLTLTTSFPLIAITLRNNLQTLFIEKHNFETQNYIIRRFVFPLSAIVPPFIITFNTENVQSLVSFTGCYGGAMIQYIIPVSLVYCSRKTCANILGEGIVNKFRSRFQSNLWLLMIFAWTCISLVLVSIHLFK